MDITVCIPTYNRIDYLQSLLETIPSSIEVCISDNGAYISNQFDAYQNVRITHHREVKSMFANWNAAVNMVRTKWFIIPGDDDLLNKSSFLKLPKILSRYEDVGMIICGHKIVDEKNNFSDGWSPNLEEKIDAPLGFLRFLYGVEARVPSIIFNTASFRAVGGFDERFLFTAADSYLIQKIAINNSIAFVPIILGFYRIWNNNFTATNVYTMRWLNQIELWQKELSSQLLTIDNVLHVDVKKMCSVVYKSNVEYGLQLMKQRHIGKIKRISFVLKSSKCDLLRPLDRKLLFKDILPSYLFRIYRKVFRKAKTINAAMPYHTYNYYIDDSSINRGMSIRFDNPIIGRRYLEIGKDCIISGQFIFESKEGYISIGNHSYIGNSTFISRSKIEIGNNVTIAWGCTIYDHNSHSLDYLERRKDIDDELQDIRAGRNFIENKDWSVVNSKPIKICDDAWIGMNCIILKGVTIGEGAVVGAGSIVTKDVPAWTVVAGNPAKVVKHLMH